MSTNQPQVARLLFLASALGEMGIGAIGLAYPQILGILLDVELNRDGLLVARMLAAAALAIGITWWMARNASDALSRNAMGFLVYNFGIGALFVVQGLSALHPALPLLLGLVHLAAGLAFLVLLSRTRDASQP